MNDSVKSWVFVSVQAILLILLIFLTNSVTKVSDIQLFVGNFLKLLGGLLLFISFYDLRKSLTALPQPTKNGVLQVRGLYKYVRHPMYGAVLTLSTGIAVSSGSLVKYLLVICLFILFNYKARYEEELLLAKYPGYKAYTKKTRRFIPLNK